MQKAGHLVQNHDNIPKKINSYNYLFKRQTIVPKYAANYPAENGTVGEHARISDKLSCASTKLMFTRESKYVTYFLVGTRQLHISLILVWPSWYYQCVL